MQVKKIFLASSSELKVDREQFEIFIYRKSNLWRDQGILLELVVWENFIDALSETRLQDEYNEAIRDCDIFVMLFFTKVGKYTEEEFETALHHFKAEGKPLVYTYFKTTETNQDSPSDRDQKSLEAFKNKLRELGHFKTEFANVDALKFHFSDQLDKLAVKGFFKNEEEAKTPDKPLDAESLIDKIKEKIPRSRSLSKLVDKYKEELLKMDPDAENDLLLFKARCYSLEKNLNMGVISSENATINRNRLNAVLLSMLDDFENAAKD